jgi:hypothetical protein
VFPYGAGPTRPARRIHDALKQAEHPILAQQVLRAHAAALSLFAGQS